MNHLLDKPFVRNSQVLRKGLSFAMRPFAGSERLMTSPVAYLHRPPLVVNSLPKSGTHLLLQVARAMPGSRYRGRFLASSPSLTQRERSGEAIARHLCRVLPGEVLGAHIYHSAQAAKALDDINAVHLFICRDPRDVLISELHYLTHMNRWHRMHRHFAHLPDFESRLRLALDGYDDRYPACNDRMLPYAGWMSCKNTVVVRYEDLTGLDKLQQLDRVIGAFEARGGKVSDRPALAATLAGAMNPRKSHTFRKGGSGNWRDGLSEDRAREITATLAPSMAAFGY